MRRLLACSVVVLAGCTSVDGPVTVPLEILVYAEDDPRPSSGGFVTQAKRAVVESDGAEYSLMAWAVGDTVTLGAMAKSDARYEAAFGMMEPVTFPLGPDAHGDLVDAQGSERKAEGAGFRGFHWVTFQMSREDLPEGSPLSLTFFDRAWQVGAADPELSPQRRPLTEVIEPRPVELPEPIPVEGEENLLNSAVFEIRYVEAPAEER